MQVTVHLAKNLPVVGTLGLCDVLAEVTFGERTEKTKVVSRALTGANSAIDPLFEEHFVFENAGGSDDLVLTLRGREGFSSPFIGKVDLCAVLIHQHDT